MIFDSHVHTDFSGDSDMKIADAIKRAEELGIGLVITDHMDINDYIKNRSGFDVEKFFEAYEKLRSDKLLLGIELGLREEAVERNIRLVNNYDFDFILGSTHAQYTSKHEFEFFDAEVYVGKSKREAYEEYFESMIRGIKENEYIDSLAHIDYIARYSRYEDKELYYEEYKELIDTVLKEVAIREKSMEISTRRIGDKTSAHELMKIYKRFRELGGETVTIGSDGHYPGAIGANFKIALEMAEACGLKPVYYKKRKIHLIR
ncbi:histidinol phosphate phosphatase [Oceanirhabdus sp. W0125-5]|uniref:histidinol phosphate phosphatase n=1 Tax=Oceanirhabdus sp. W0125-5 TaxID=2999116 RepID=UPI0022F2CC5E|nr:histidinol phosphate phosphatase [Oceanirhabdus sp. W0125-5]WBW98123.1 histidinol phosphate phosphatase [Oceanirhabdus sp. W0125-5]